MSTIRTIKSKDYSVICNTFLRDERLSWKAKGILAYLLSKPDNWKVKVVDLIKRSTDGREKVYGGIKELLHTGYLQREEIRLKGKIISYEYILHESGMPSPLSAFPDTVKSDTVLSDAVKADTVNPEAASVYNQILSIPNTEVNQILTDRQTAPKKSDQKKSQSVGQSVSQSVPPLDFPEHEQGIQEKAVISEVSALTELLQLCNLKNKSVELAIAAGLKSHSPEYVMLQIEYVNDKCKNMRNYKYLLEKAIENKDGKNWGQAHADVKAIDAREREAAADKARRAAETSNALKAFQTHSGKEKAVTITLSQNVAETADGKARESKISEFLSSISPERVDNLKSDFLKNAKTLIKKRARTQGFDSLLVKSAFESYISKEVMTDERTAA